jgi:iron complex outermembrane receptor protein
VEKLEEDQSTHQAGVTYALTPNLNVYVSYGDTFEPQIANLASGEPADPEEGRAYEVGLKGDFGGHRVSYSLALFNMERTNIVEVDRQNPGFDILAGTQRSRGIELDLEGEVLPGWDMYLSAASLDAEFTQGELAGARPANAPKFGLSLFTSYEVQNGSWQGLGIGGGVVHKAGREMNDLFSYGGLTRVGFLDDYTEVDLRVFYTRQRWQFELAASNVFDEDYYSNAFAQLITGFQVNPPRQFLGSMRYKF